MRHFDHLTDDARRRLFWRAPEPFSRESPRETLAVALGATLYMPATRPRLAHDLARRASQGVASSVVCLEDSIADDELPAAQANAIAQLRELAQAGGGPLTFVRVRTPDQIPQVVDGLGEHAHVLSGFVLPKFSESTGAAFLDALDDTAATHGLHLWAMPVIESPEMIHRETRGDQLLAVRALLDKHRASVLAVRTGATDLSGVYGIRRGRDLSIYDVRLVAEVLTDVVNILGRADGSGFVVTGPVWEYYGGNERLFKPRLRQAPFQASDAEDLRASLITQDLDGLIREVVLDAANGLTGKTVIHPSHVPVVHALSVVTHEEYVDASDVLGRDAGAAASAYRNKMNESRPHRAWAERVLTRAAVFGVAEPDVGFVDLLGAGDDW
ncbi:HpcH/HpaI aldolase/citrate lyase family protein [Cellulomonas edaphi]|uniref:HpcH/HpaI aldolase/citrate lyase family protein n=1 Tax=Cellulomonas edaphi TaxID=3053468 RepID=A0ABT7S713_9CELL|nr:HpcH/HpaI aldolase/citrate lyase family protein [Cellulomons edaphi]MDM7830734.1 HpcH/HpaI aldolase/citrate lyase family protein [Cellulomons edaphi]